MRKKPEAARKKAKKKVESARRKEVNGEIKAAQSHVREVMITMLLIMPRGTVLMVTMTVNYLMKGQLLQLSYYVLLEDVTL